jgi:tetratricopeptide (TPR) repeat protein
MNNNKKYLSEWEAKEAQIERGEAEEASRSTFEEDKINGNKYFNNGDYNTALKYYGRALKKQEDKIIYLNRAAVHLKLDFYYQALLDAEKAVGMGANEEKSWFRIGKAL